MTTITLNPQNAVGTIKRMHSVNNGPAKCRIDNCDDYRRAGIPFARNHDASYCEEYGSEHCVDVIGIFPDFDADPYDEKSYDFAITDKYLQTTLETGTQIFYRLGNRIEHYCKGSRLSSITRVRRMLKMRFVCFLTVNISFSEEINTQKACMQSRLRYNNTH